MADALVRFATPKHWHDWLAKHHASMTEGVWLELAKKSGVTYPLVADSGGAVNGASPFAVVRGVPWFVFVDAEGHVTNVPGGVESADELVELANEHLGTDL